MTDLMFLVVDHYEPSIMAGESGVQQVRNWCTSYAQVASCFRDSDGVCPQHSWFYRYDYPNPECVRILSEFVFRGYGEIEFHLHHGNDTPESFAKKIHGGVEWFNRFGAMITAEREPLKRFAYIAGDWALDNGRGDDALSGCNLELSILRDAGCYADFTFPAFGETSQPRMINSIYYAKDTPAPKSYDRGVPMRVGGAPSGDLLIFEGPLYVDWLRGYIDYAALETYAPYHGRRLEYWTRPGIGVIGRPEWTFVKLHTHGMQSRRILLGPQMEQLHRELNAMCSRTGCRLHYVSAREAYNIAKAAEAGMEGDAGQYRDFEIARPVNRRMLSNAPALVRTYSRDHVKVDVVQPSSETELAFSEHPVISINGGRVTGVDMRCSDGELRQLQILGEGNARLRLRSRACDGESERYVSLPYVSENCRTDLQST